MKNERIGMRVNLLNIRIKITKYFDKKPNKSRKIFQLPATLYNITDKTIIVL